MYEMSQRHPVWATENHVNPCNSAGQTAPSNMPDCTQETRRLLLLQILMRSSIYVLYSPQLFNTTGLQNKTVYRTCLFY
jgi:hypothetical protein